jgi:RNA methyltransferase, TrmH family
MISKNQIKHLQSLHLKKFRETYREFIAEGSTIIKDFAHSPYHVKQIYALENWAERNQDLINNITISVISYDEMEKISTLSSPGPALAVLEIPETTTSPNPEEGKLILMLDEIKDPGNFGTIIRIADWFGIETIYCSENSVEIFNSKVVHASMGSIARVKVHRTNLKRLLENRNQSIKIFGAYVSGENIYSCPLPEYGIILVGNESEGISQDLIQHINVRISIPSFADALASSSPESLNVAAATAIICSEFRRRANM